MRGSRKGKPEKIAEDDFVKYAATYQCLALKYAPDKSADWPDRLVLLPDNRFFWLEFKREGEVPRESQHTKHRYLRAWGHKVYWVDNLEDAKKILHETLRLSK